MATMELHFGFDEVSVKVGTCASMFEIVTPRPKIQVKFDRGVSPDIRRHVRRVLPKLARVSPPDRLVPIHVSEKDCVRIPQGNCWGAMVYHWPRGDVEIVIATGLMQKRGKLRPKDIRHLLLVLLHEYAHYEQYRDGRKPGERGVNVRAKSLLKRIKAAG
jgi:hypothetical protein